MPAPPKQAVTVRMDERDLSIVECTMRRLAEQNPSWPQVTRSDAVRHLIVAGSHAAAAPIASTRPPDPEKPMRSG